MKSLWQLTWDDVNPARHPPRSKGLEHAAGKITLAVIEVTACSDAWYRHAERVLGWYLRHRGLSNERARTISAEALKGRFASWVTPDEEVQREAASALAQAGALALDELTQKARKRKKRKKQRREAPRLVAIRKSKPTIPFMPNP